MRGELILRRSALTLFVTLLAAGCTDPLDVSGHRCDETHPCPVPWVCSAGTCQLNPIDAGGEVDSGTVAVDSGVVADAEPADRGRTDADPVDAGPTDVDPTDAMPDSGPPPDGGLVGPNPERCLDAVAYPPSGYEVRYYSLDQQNEFASCLGVETITGDGIDRDYGAGGPFAGAEDRIGARYTATRDFVTGVSFFDVDHDDGLRIRVDGAAPVYDVWAPSTVNDARTFTGYLQAGAHQVEIDHFEDLGNARVRVELGDGCPLPNPGPEWTIRYVEETANEPNPAHCILVKTAVGNGVSDSAVGTPAEVLAAGVVNYSVLAATRRNFGGMTRFDIAHAGGMRLIANGGTVLQDDWTLLTGGAPVVDARLALFNTVEVSTRGGGSGHSVALDYTNHCDLVNGLGTTEWGARYYGLMVSGLPGLETFAIDYDDCLGSEVHAGVMFSQDWGEDAPPPVWALGIFDRWAMVLLGQRTLTAPANFRVHYHLTGVRVLSSTTVLYENFRAPFEDEVFLSLPVGTYDFRIEYFDFDRTSVQLDIEW